MGEKQPAPHLAPPPRGGVLTKLMSSPGSIVAVLGLAWIGLSLFNDDVKTRTDSSSLVFGPISFAGHDNYVYRDSVTSAQIVISSATSEGPVRFLTAFPKGNTGSVIFFNPTDGPLGATFNLSSVKSVSADGQVGITGALSLTSDFDFGPTIIGSVRTIRNYLEAGVTHPLFDHKLGAFSDQSVSFVRNWMNGTTVQYLSFRVGDNCRITTTPAADSSQPPHVHVSRINKAQDAVLRFVTTFNFDTTKPKTSQEPQVGLNASDVFLSEEAVVDSPAPLKDVLTAIHGAPDITNQLAFLSYTSGFLAGGWRFLTYFGRDTLFTLQLLMPVMSSEAAESILAGVIQRTNATSGELCHEETIGDYATIDNMFHGFNKSGNKPWYSYTMLDTDFLLLPVLANYLASPQGVGRDKAFLLRKSALGPGTFKSLLLKNINHVVEVTAPFAKQPDPGNLIPIRSYPLGNWRDSPAGLGWGTYPFDVQCVFIPAALRAIAQLADTGVIPANYSSTAEAAVVWEREACKLFEVPIPPTKAETALASYVKAANLSSELLYGPGCFKSSAAINALGDDGWNAPRQTIGTPSASTLYALSLNAYGKPITVQHSDLGFALLYSPNISPKILKATIEALQPYPRGLLTNVGMLVANAAYDDTTPGQAETFSNRAYHGAVAWGWQQALMAQGLSKQLGLCGLSPDTQLAKVTGGRPAWCDDSELTDALIQAQRRLWTSITGSQEVLYTEVWSSVYNNGAFEVGDLGAISSDGSEGDAFQLWSYAFLAQVDARTGRPVASGFSSIASFA